MCVEGCVEGCEASEHNLTGLFLGACLKSVCSNHPLLSLSQTLVYSHVEVRRICESVG